MQKVVVGGALIGVLALLLYFFHKETQKESARSDETYIISALTVLFRLLFKLVKVIWAILMDSVAETQEKNAKVYDRASQRSDESIMRELREKRKNGTLSPEDKGLVDVARERGLID